MINLPLVMAGDTTNRRGRVSNHAPTFRKLFFVFYAFSAANLPNPILPLQPVQRPGVVADDLFRQRGCQTRVGAEVVDRHQLGGAVGVGVVGADDDIVFAQLADDVGNIVGGLAGDEDAVPLQEVGVEFFILQAEAFL